MDKLTLEVLAVTEPRRPVTWTREVYSSPGVVRTIGAHAECLRWQLHRDVVHYPDLEVMRIGTQLPDNLHCVWCGKPLKPV